MKIENILVANDVDEFIELLFKEVFEVRTQQYYKGELYEGFNIQLPKIKKSNFKEMNGIFKIFYMAESKAKKIFLGDNNKYDYENYRQQSREFVFEGLYSILHGEHNHKLEKDLQINSVENIKRIVTDKKLNSKFINYLLTFVELKLKNLSQSKSNPDFYFNPREGYKPIYYNYIDSEEENIQIEDNEEENKNGEITDYFFTNIFPSLSDNQQKFITKALEYGIRNQEIRDRRNRLLYNVDAVKNYKRNIRKRVSKIIKEDENIKNKNGRFIISK